LISFVTSNSNMADAAVASFAASTAKKATKKRTSGGKAKKASSHPTYRDMIVRSIQALKEHKGSSRQAILKHIVANFNVGHDLVSVNAHLKMALKRMAKDGSLKQSKGQGAAGSFRIGDKKVGRVAKKAKGPKKPRAKKAKKPKKVAAVAAGEGAAAGETPKKKKRVSKKGAKKSSPKKPKAARPKKTKSPKKAKAPKKKRSPKKKAAAKKTASK